MPKSVSYTHLSARGVLPEGDRSPRERLCQLNEFKAYCRVFGRVGCRRGGARGRRARRGGARRLARGRARGLSRRGNR